MAVTSLAILFTGYSIFTAITLALSGLQLAHFAWLYLGQAWVGSLPYRMALYCVAPAFFLFSQPVLPDHLAMPMAFVLDAGYLL